MRNPLPLAGILALAALLPAQQDPQPPKPDATARLKALEAEVRAAQDAWRVEMQRRAEEARKAAEQGKPSAMAAMSMRPDLTPLVAKAEAAARDYAGTDDAVPFLVWVVQNGGGAGSEAAQAAIATLTDEHAASPAIRGLVAQYEFLPRMVGAEAAQAFVAAVRQKSEDPDVLGWAALGEFGPVIDGAAPDSDAYREARAKLLAHIGTATDERLGQQIQAKIDLRERFGVGAVAPDIEGIDLDGEAFRLSDYAGKVVFLDFWGDW
jgi:hypothetical protein